MVGLSDPRHDHKQSAISYELQQLEGELQQIQADLFAVLKKIEGFWPGAEVEAGDRQRLIDEQYNAFFNGFISDLRRYKMANADLAALEPLLKELSKMHKWLLEREDAKLRRDIPELNGVADAELEQAVNRRIASHLQAIADLGRNTTDLTRPEGVQRGFAEIIRVYRNTLQKQKQALGGVNLKYLYELEPQLDLDLMLLRRDYSHHFYNLDKETIFRDMAPEYGDAVWQRHQQFQRVQAKFQRLNSELAARGDFTFGEQLRNMFAVEGQINEALRMSGLDQVVESHFDAQAARVRQVASNRLDTSMNFVMGVGSTSLAAAIPVALFVPVIGLPIAAGLAAFGGASLLIGAGVRLRRQLANVFATLKKAVSKDNKPIAASAPAPASIQSSAASESAELTHRDAPAVPPSPQAPPLRARPRSQSLTRKPSSAPAKPARTRADSMPSAPRGGMFMARAGRGLIVDEFRHVKVDDDGNCFYHAVALQTGKTAQALRQSVQQALRDCKKGRKIGEHDWTALQAFVPGLSEAVELPANYAEVQRQLEILADEDSDEHDEAWAYLTEHIDNLDREIVNAVVQEYPFSQENILLVMGHEVAHDAYAGVTSMDDYLDKLTDDGLWADDMQTLALAYALKRPVVILDVDEHSVVVKGEELAGVPLFVSRQNGNHYNALILPESDNKPAVARDVLQRMREASRAKRPIHLPIDQLGAQELSAPTP